MKKIILPLIAMVTVGSLLISACAETAPPVIERTTFKVLAWSSLPSVMEAQQPAAWDLFSKIEEESGGKITFEFVGGTEIYPLFEQGEALVAGTICDVLMSGGGFIASTSPGLLAVANSVGTQAEKRANGFVDLVNEIVAEDGVFWLTELDPSGYDDWNMIFLNEPITTLDDLEGLIIAVAGPQQFHVINHFGGVGTFMGPAGFYTAMERGTVDGYVYPLLSTAWFGRGLEEVTEFFVTPGFSGSGVGIFFNLDVWESLPQDSRDLIMEMTLEMEEEWTPRWLATYERYMAQFRMAGIGELRLSAADHAALEAVNYDLEWDAIFEMLQDDWSLTILQELRELAGT